MHCFESFCGRRDFDRIFYLIEKNGSFCIVNTCKMLPLNRIKTIVTQILSAISLSFSLSLELQHVVLMFWCFVCHFEWMRHFIIVASKCVFFSSSLVPVQLYSTNEFTVIFITKSFVCTVYTHWAGFCVALVPSGIRHQLQKFLVFLQRGEFLAENFFSNNN